MYLLPTVLKCNADSYTTSRNDVANYADNQTKTEKSGQFIKILPVVVEKRTSHNSSSTVFRLNLVFGSMLNKQSGWNFG